MTTSVITQALFVALALVMFGLGLSLRTADFTRLRRPPQGRGAGARAAGAVAARTVLGADRAVEGAPVYAVGLMLLAASTGGVSANLFSQLFGGNVAMNISLTAINTLLSIVTLPLIANAAIAHFAGGGQVVPLQFGKVVEVIAVVLLPVVLGMLAARRWPGFAARMEAPISASRSAPTTRRWRSSSR